MGTLTQLMIQLKNFKLIQLMMIISTNPITPQISSTHNLLVNNYTTVWGGTVDFFPMKRHLKIWNPEDKFPHDPGGSIICQLIKYLQKFFAI